MSESVSTGLEPGLVISSRYRIEERLAGEGEPVGYAALDTDRQVPVVVLDVSAAAARALAKAKDLGHTHLANVLDTAEVNGKQVVVCEQVSGETLEQRLADIGTKAPVDAVRSALRVAEWKFMLASTSDDDHDVMNIGGFSDAVFSVVSSFLSGDPLRFVGEIEAVEIEVDRQVR